VHYFYLAKIGKEKVVVQIELYDCLDFRN